MIDETKETEPDFAVLVKAASDLIANADRALSSQDEASGKLIVMANYGDLALNLLRKIAGSAAVNSHEALVTALDDLQQAEAEFRLMLDRHGTDAKAAGIARDRMIIAGDKARAALAALSQARA